ncbi:adiponectin receptor protein 1 [Galendromus occidentalis]|uniref:Adiponectin receptor protein 1 n=1 Tax=Galendromus occidentalis TaxID=34638 RepID=A0AAJ6W030_9ACAR|nr:adiponectin receptor protein 1 [Galendromus occidentalis]
MAPTKIAKRPGLTPWDEILPKKFVEFEIRRRLKSIRKCIYVPSLSSIDELVPTTNFMSELGNIAEFMYSMGKSVMSRDEAEKVTVATLDGRTTTDKQRKAPTGDDNTSVMSSDDEGIVDTLSSMRRHQHRTLDTLTVLSRRKLASVSSRTVADGFLADQEDNDVDDDDESSGFYSDGSEYAPCMPNVKSRAFRPRSQSGLYLHSQLPMWLKNNEFIVGGHRPPAYSYKACLRSVIHLHSETGNIWSHGLGALGFAMYAIYFFSADVIPHMNIYDRLAFGVFFLSAIGCMGMSAIYHTLACHSNRVCSITCKLDFTGITILIFGSFYPWLYYTFYDQPALRCLYGLLGTVSALATIKMNLNDSFAHAEYRGVRSAVYISYAMICGVLPVVHFSMIYGVETLYNEHHLLRFACMVISYVVGALFYSIRIPEKYWPGKFDYAGHSHQIMHICVVFGNLAHYWGCHGLAYRRHVLMATDCSQTSMYSTLEPFISMSYVHIMNFFN